MSFQVTVLPSQHQFPAAADQSVLDAALAAGIVLPYSCKSGACSTCKAKVVSGSIEEGATPTQILSPEEREAGFTLLCQAHASSDLVIESREVRLATDIQIRKLPSRVTSMQRMAPDVEVLQLQLPAADTFRFYAGQYIEVLLKDGKRRSYSMANPPHAAAAIELHIRHLPGGLFTDHVFGTGATQMKEREILRLEGPYGSFFLREDSTLPIIMLASGTGFAPIKAMVEHMAHQEIRRPVTLYWGGRRPADLYMNALAQSWAQSIPDFTYIPVISDALPEDNWTGRTGFVHRAVMEDFPDMSGYQVYACGAPIVVNSAQKEFKSACNLPEDAFFADSFTSEADTATAKGL
jgi:CDP-4-dehydro-6-deoxyglucose reductase